MESRIKQELTITQKSLNSTGNMVFKLKLQIKDMKAQQNNLQQFKITNDKEFVELQREVNKYKNFELVDPVKLKKEWVKQDKFKADYSK